MKRRTIKTAIVSLAFMFLFGLFAPTAEAACGGCFCKAGSGTSGKYSCVTVMGYNRWMPTA